MDLKKRDKNQLDILENLTHTLINLKVNLAINIDLGSTQNCIFVDYVPEPHHLYLVFHITKKERKG